MKKNKFSVVLPTFNRLSVLRKVLFPSIEKQDYNFYEFIIVDDYSSDGTSTYLLSEQFRKDFPRISTKITLVTNKVNKGSPLSRNIGFDRSSGDWIYMVEDDLELRDENFLNSANDIIDSLEDEKIVVVSPKREEFIHGYYKNFNGKFVNIGFVSGEIYLDPTVEYSGLVPNTQACSFIRSDIAKAFRYDHKSYSYFREESDFYKRITLAGYKIYYCGDKLRSYHRMDLVSGGGNRKHSVSIKNEVKYIKSHYTFLKKYSKFANARIVAFVFVREIKNLGNLAGLRWLKNVLSYIKL